MQPHVSNCYTGWYPYQPWGPCGSCGGGGMWPWGYPYATPQAIAWTWCPCQGEETQPPPQEPSVTLPKEIEVDSESTTATAVIGGTAETQVFVEYMKDAAADPASVTVEVTHGDGSGSSTWTETAIPDGYNVKTDLQKVSPGSTIRIEVANALARARWVEVTSAAAAA